MTCLWLDGKFIDIWSVTVSWILCGNNIFKFEELEEGEKSILAQFSWKNCTSVPSVHLSRWVNHPDQRSVIDFLQTTQTSKTLRLNSSTLLCAKLLPLLPVNARARRQLLRITRGCNIRDVYQIGCKLCSRCFSLRAQRRPPRRLIRSEPNAARGSGPTLLRDNMCASRGEDGARRTQTLASSSGLEKRVWVEEFSLLQCPKAGGLTPASDLWTLRTRASRGGGCPSCYVTNTRWRTFSSSPRPT